jgi:hypothetical protein
MKHRGRLVCGLIVGLGMGLGPLSGCVQRTISISSHPEGALVWLNGREVGRTPVEVEFLHYGTYDVRLTKDGYESMLTSGEAKPPWWDSIPFDLVAEMTPGEKVSRIAWHYDLLVLPEDPDRLRADLRDRADLFRARAAEGE